MADTATAIARVTRQEEEKEKKLSDTSFSYLDNLTKTPLDQAASDQIAKKLSDKRGDIEKRVKQGATGSNSSSSITAGTVASEVGREAVNEAVQFSASLDPVLPHSVYAGIQDAAFRQASGMASEIIAQQKAEIPQAEPQAQKEKIPTGIKTPQAIAQAIGTDINNGIPQDSKMPGMIQPIYAATPVADSLATKQAIKDAADIDISKESPIQLKQPSKEQAQTIAGKSQNTFTSTETKEKGQKNKINWNELDLSAATKIGSTTS